MNRRRFFGALLGVGVTSGSKPTSVAFQNPVPVQTAVIHCGVSASEVLAMLAVAVKRNDRGYRDKLRAALGSTGVL